MHLVTKYRLFRLPLVLYFRDNFWLPLVFWLLFVCHSIWALAGCALPSVLTTRSSRVDQSELPEPLVTTTVRSRIKPFAKKNVNHNVIMQQVINHNSFQNLMNQTLVMFNWSVTMHIAFLDRHRPRLLSPSCSPTVFVFKILIVVWYFLNPVLKSCVCI